MQYYSKKPQKTNHNSGKPSSQTRTDKTSRSSKSKGKKEDILSADNSRTIITDTLLSVTSCQCCRESLQNNIVKGIERRTKIDIVFEKHCGVF